MEIKTKSINRTIYSSYSSKVLSLFCNLCSFRFISFLTARRDDCGRLTYVRALGKCLLLLIVFLLNFRGIADNIRCRLSRGHIIDFTVTLLTFSCRFWFSHSRYELYSIHLLVILLFLLCKVHWCGLLLHEGLWLLLEGLSMRLLLESNSNILI